MIVVDADKFYVPRPRQAVPGLREPGPPWSESETSRWARYRAELIEWAKSLPRWASVLDFGSGPGYLSAYVNGPYFGVDEDCHAIMAMRARGVQCGHEIQHRSFSAAVLYHVLEHCEYPFRELESVVSAVRPGGELIVGMPDFGCPAAVRFGDRYRMLADPTHVSLFTLESAHRFVRHHGLIVDRVTFPCVEPGDWDTDGISPEWPGNWFTLWCKKH